jgi:multidrug efflux pump subunit AcrA (membrane-fusion protein)
METREQIFRKEALEHQEIGMQERGTVLRLSPGWTRWAFWLLLGVVVFYGCFGVVGRMSEYASGPAVVRMAERLEVTAVSAGRITAVEVRPGQRVKEGQVLARFQSEPRALLAPWAGVVGEVRVQPGAQLTEGDVIVSLLRKDSPLEVVAMLPGEYRPWLSTTGKLRLELQGFPYQYQELAIEEVGESLVDPRQLGPSLGVAPEERPEAGGSVVLVRARLPSRSFESEGQRLTYFDGMRGTAEVHVRTERIATVLIPGLKRLFP